MIDSEVMVVGAGPAGAVTARETARLGRDVLLVERQRLPRSKICGCCLSPGGVRALERLGLGEALREAAPLDLGEVELVAGGRRAAVRLARGGVAVSRSGLDAALTRAAVRAGARLIDGTRAELLGRDTDSWRVDLAGSPARARVVVAADGLGGALFRRGGVVAQTEVKQSRIGAGALAPRSMVELPEGRVVMVFGATGYLGAVRLGSGDVDLAAAIDPEEVRRAGGIGPAIAGMLEGAGAPEFERALELDWTGTPALTREAQVPACHRGLLVGDAAGYVEPFSGEGMTWAVRTGVAAAPLAAGGVRDWTPEIEAEWSARRSSLIGARQRSCARTARVLRWPFMVSTFVRLAALSPGAARRALARFQGAAA